MHNYCSECLKNVAGDYSLYDVVTGLMISAREIPERNRAICSRCFEAEVDANEEADQSYYSEAMEANETQNQKESGSGRTPGQYYLSDHDREHWHYNNGISV
jgi:hypothetical protein